MTSIAPASQSQDRVLAELVEEVTNRLQAGEAVDVAAYAERHPEYADQLRQLVPALQALAAWSGAGGQRLPEVPDSPTGTLGDYRILREVGRGGMGVVYEAEQISLGRRVALKVLPFAATMDPRHLQRFHNEARAAASLQHPHIVQVFAVGCERAVHFYAMQFIDGRTLADVIAAQREATEPRPAESEPRPSGRVREARPVAHAPGSETTPRAAGPTLAAPPDAAYYRRLAGWGVQAAEALEQAHRTGIVHRDVKPANLLLDAHGTLYVTDFGLARLGTAMDLTMTGDVLGTLRYMAPEQALAKHGLADHRVDVYALGATLYEVIALRPAVDGTDREEVLRKIAFEDPPPLWTLTPSPPVELGVIVGKAMAKAPEGRYATAQELADDLRRFLDHRPILARPPALGPRLLKWARRHQAGVLTGMAGLLLLVVALAVGAWLLWQEQGRTRDALGQAEESQRVAEQRAAEAQRMWQVAQVQKAHQAWDAGDVLLARKTLVGCRPPAGDKEFCGFAWRHLWHRCEMSPENPVVLRGHAGDVYAVTFAPDGRTVATAGKDGTARLWDAATGKVLWKLSGHEGEVNGVAFSPDGKTLATASDDRTVRLWDVATGTERRRLTGHPSEVIGVVFTPDGKSLISADKRDQVKVWDPATGRERGSFAHNHADNLEAIALSQDGKLLATTSKDRRTRVWEVASQKEKHDRQAANMCRAVAFSPDGRTLAAGCMKCVRSGEQAGLVEVWTAGTNEYRTILRADRDDVEAVAFTPDGRGLVTAGREGIIRVWDVASWKLDCAFQLRDIPDRVWGLAFAKDGRLAVSSQAGLVTLWRPTPRYRQALDSSEACHGGLAFSPDGRELATTGWADAARRWAVPTGRTLATHRMLLGRSGYYLAYSPDGACFALTDRDSVLVVDRGTGNVNRCEVAGDAIFGLAFPADSRSVFALVKRPPVQLPGLLRRWKLDSGNLLSVPGNLSDGMDAIVATPDGLMLAYQRGAEIHGVRWPNRRRPVILPPPDATLLAISPDGASVAVGVHSSGVTRVYDLRAGRLRATLAGHLSRVICAAFCPDGETLATGSMIGEMKVWNWPTGQELLTLDRRQGCCVGIAFSPDGNLLGTSGTVEKESVTILWRAPVPAAEE